MNQFWEETLSEGYYDVITVKGIKRNRGLNATWHNFTNLKVKHLINNKGKHLDYACGPGTLIGLYSHANSTGYDIAKLQIEYANSKYKNHKSEFTYYEDKVFNKTYDVITIMGLFEYLEEIDILNLLKKLKNSLSQNGKIIITTPNYNSLIRILEIFSNFFGSVNYSKVNINKLNKKKLTKIISKTDYKINKIHKFLNFGVLFSVFSLKTGIKVENIVLKTFKNFFGYLLFVEIELDD